MKKKTIFIILSIILIAVLAYLLFFRRVIIFDYASFRNHKAEWIKKDLTDYSYEYSFGCGEGWGRYGVIVENKKVVSVEDLLKDGAAGQLENDYYSIENVFNRLKDEYISGKNNRFRDRDDCVLRSIEVEYNSEYFFPTHYSANYVCPDSVADGGGCSHTVSNFKVKN